MSEIPKGYGLNFYERFSVGISVSRSQIDVESKIDVKSRNINVTGWNHDNRCPPDLKKGYTNKESQSHCYFHPVSTQTSETNCRPSGGSDKIVLTVCFLSLQSTRTPRKRLYVYFISSDRPRSLMTWDFAPSTVPPFLPSRFPDIVG